jgi:hypothetical protein
MYGVDRKPKLAVPGVPLTTKLAVMVLLPKARPALLKAETSPMLLAAPRPPSTLVFPILASP